MTTTAAPTAGHSIAAALRKNFGIGTRTSRYGKVFGHRTDLHEAMIEAIENAVRYPGYYSPEKTETLRGAYGAAISYRKHVQGYRIDGMTALAINKMSAYQFAALIGRMADAGVQTTGEGERFFDQMARENRSV
jgi:hypothetical protein